LNEPDLHAVIFGRQNDPETIDLIGVGETVESPVGTFNTIAAAYLSMCSGAPERYRRFPKWLKSIKQQAIRRCRAKWRGRGDWFDRRPLPNAAAQLESAAVAWCRKARAREEEALDFKKERPAEVAGAPTMASVEPPAATTAASPTVTPEPLVPTEPQRLDDVPMPKKPKGPRKLRGLPINGPYLKELFIGTGFTKARFAKELGLSLSTYLKAENGRRLDETKVRLIIDNLNPVLRKDKDNLLTVKDLILPH
jgi:hypothetical protein